MIYNEGGSWYKIVSKENSCEIQNIHIMNNSWYKISHMDEMDALVEMVKNQEPPALSSNWISHFG